MSFKFFLALGYIVLISFLFIDHARTHDGKFFTVKDFRNAMFNCIKSHEGLIIVATIFYIGCIIGMLITIANGRLSVT